MPANKTNSDVTGLWTKQDVAYFFGVAKSTVDHWVARGQGGPPHVKLGRLVRFRVEDVHDYVRDRIQQQGASSGRALERNGRCRNDDRHPNNIALGASMPE